MSESEQPDVLTFWLVAASGYNKRQAIIMTFTYVHDGKEARKNLQDWLAQFPDRPIHTFKPYPNGFNCGYRNWQPGSITKTENEKT